ncbi:MAG: alpha/beta hydrolase [Paracoccaceae bacterium]|nr:alpha/beta hydrolase [Paracoccaceae bacterium]
MRALALDLALAGPAQAKSLYEASSSLDLFPCELSSLHCTTLTPPLDHRANDPARTIDITFALSFANVESRGILFYFVGGPGASGLASAESYLSSFDQSLTDYMDVVFVDQRGTGPEHGLACPVAQGRFDAADLSIRDPEGAKAAARAYVADCTAEMNRPDLLPFVSSDQAIRDTEAFRQRIGAPKVWLYGESYGTQFVQAYATAFPQAVRGVILDGVVALSLDAPGCYTSYTLAADEILARTLDACADIAPCARDMGQDAAALYDRIAARLDQQPIPVALTLSTGQTVERQLTRGFFESSTFFALYSPEGRAEFLRALAAAGRDNFVPLLQLGYANMYIDQETGIGIEDPGWFGAAFFAITCTDYDSGSGTPDQRADRILAQAADLAPQAPRLLRAYYQEQLACAYWPHQGPPVRPAPYAGGDWPTLILNGDADPITPIAMAYDVLDSATNAFGIFMQGGPHVIWSRGLSCPDGIVRAALMDGILPPAREQHCRQDLVQDYAPLTLVDPAEHADPLAIAQAVDTELYQSIALSVWDGIHPVTIGCDHGGTLTAMPTDLGTDYSFQDCRFWPDLGISGTGVEINLGEPDDRITLALTVAGNPGGTLRYEYRLADEAWSISGRWNGQPIHLPRLP